MKRVSHFGPTPTRCRAPAPFHIVAPLGAGPRTTNTTARYRPGKLVVHPHDSQRNAGCQQQSFDNLDIDNSRHKQQTGVGYVAAITLPTLYMRASRLLSENRRMIAYADAPRVVCAWGGSEASPVSPRRLGVRLPDDVPGCARRILRTIIPYYLSSTHGWCNTDEAYLSRTRV